MKRLINVSMIVALFAGADIFFLSGCSTKSKEEGEVVKQVQEQSGTFLKEMAKRNFAIIELSKLADEKSVNRDVLKLTRSALSYHAEQQALLAKLAEDKNIDLEESILADVKQYKKLKKQQNLRFDIEYCKLMVKEHEAFMERLETAAKELRDRDIRNFVEATMPEMRTQFDGALYTQRQIKAIAELQ